MLSVACVQRFLQIKRLSAIVLHSNLTKFIPKPDKYHCSAIRKSGKHFVEILFSPTFEWRCNGICPASEGGQIKLSAASEGFVTTAQDKIPLQRHSEAGTRALSGFRMALQWYLSGFGMNFAKFECKTMALTRLICKNLCMCATGNKGNYPRSSNFSRSFF